MELTVATAPDGAVAAGTDLAAGPQESSTIRGVPTSKDVPFRRPVCSEKSRLCALGHGDGQPLTKAVSTSPRSSGNSGARSEGFEPPTF
jgi:hypothetical protein